jgi:uncharacterized membrane protein YjfL (UPF0719 family)
MDYLRFVVTQYLVTLGWAIVGAISMGIGLAVAMKAFTILTPKIDEVEELKKGNLGVAIVLAAVIVAVAVVVAVTVMPAAVR